MNIVFFLNRQQTLMHHYAKLTEVPRTYTSAFFLISLALNSVIMQWRIIIPNIDQTKGFFITFFMTFVLRTFFQLIHLYSHSWLSALLSTSHLYIKINNYLFTNKEHSILTWADTLSTMVS